MQSTVLEKTRLADEIERLVKEVGVEAKSWEKSKQNSDPAWTRAIKGRLADLGRRLDFEVCCHKKGIEVKPHWGEWLYDLCWLKPSGDDDGLYVAMPLAVEIEWNPDRDEVLPDFQKVAFSAADFRVMIWQSPTPQELEETARLLRKQIRLLKHHESKYLLLGLDMRKLEFRTL